LHLSATKVQWVKAGPLSMSCVLKPACLLHTAGAHSQSVSLPQQCRMSSGWRQTGQPLHVERMLNKQFQMFNTR